MTISIRKTNIMCQCVDHTPEMTVNNNKLEVVNEFTYLGQSVSHDLLWIPRPTGTSGLQPLPLPVCSKESGENGKLTIHIKVAVYKASSAPSSMAASLGLLTPDRKRD